jgi:hypothetical protein
LHSYILQICHNNNSKNNSSLPVTAEGHALVALVSSATRGASLGVQMASTLETTALATGRGQSAELAVLVHSIADPVDTGIVTDGLVSGVNKNDLKVLINSVLVNPVRVENAESSALAANALLSKVSKVASRLQLGDTSVNRLTIVNTLQL